MERQRQNARRDALSAEARMGLPTEEEILQALELRHTKPVQDRLSAAKVAVCGLGGLGSAIAIALARCGVGKLHLIDFDRVDLTNLNRQQYAADQLGKPKPQAMAEEIRRFSPYARLKTDFVKMTEENIPDLLAEDEYICEAFDRPEQKAMLTNTVLTELPDRYLVGASGMAGYGDSNAIQTKRITSRYYLCGDRVSETGPEGGLMAPRVMICAAHQANMIVRLILGKEDE
ncbi:MAG: sulfur carrier protein ThiS adenylyltransferase ThiF [Emergencia sp.]